MGCHLAEFILSSTTGECVCTKELLGRFHPGNARRGTSAWIRSGIHMPEIIKCPEEVPLTSDPDLEDHELVQGEARSFP